MASQTITLKAAGLQTYYQTLMEISPGALLKANNTVINRNGVIEPRRGFAAYGSAFTLTTDRAKQLIEYKGRVLRHIGSTLAYDDGVGTFTDFTGSYTEPVANYRIRSVEAKSNLYFTTSEGVKKIAARTAADLSIANVVEDSGGPKAIAGSLVLNATSSFLTNGSSVNYQIMWLYTDRNQNLIFGSPSATMTIANTSGSTKSVDLTFQIPYDVTSSDYKYRIYRSEVATSPSSELYQVIEGTPSPAELTAGTITVTDTVSEAQRIAGVPLYTNQYSGEGALAANEPPPSARDIALFKGHMFYANTRTRHAANFTILSLSSFVSGTSTLVIGTTSPASSNTYTFGAAENIATKTVLLNPASIEETAKSLVRVINGTTSEIVTAYYLSVFGDTPGKILLQRKTLEDNTFYVGTSHAAIVAAFSPELGTGATIATKFTSAAEIIGNRLYYSKYQEHEAVPLLNYIDVGTRDQSIERIIALRESLFIFKGDGVFRLAGDPGPAPVWDVSVFDNTAIIKAPDTVVTLNNQCYFFGNQGVVRLNESALEPISRPIEDKLLPFIATNSNLKTVSFSVAYESDRSLLVWTVSNKTDTYATVCYRFNTYTETWTEWKIAKTCGVLNVPQDKLYLGSATDAYVEAERKNFDRFDYADRDHVIVLSTGGLVDTVMKPSGFSLMTVGDVILQEQYVTVYQFNSLLRKLDLDTGIPSSDYYATLVMSAGDNLTSKMTQLVAKLNVDDPIPVYAFSGSTNFATIQTEFNVIIGKLNLSPTAIFSNYQTSNGTVKHEAIILNLETFKKEVTIHREIPFIVGTMTLYKGISTEIQYAPQHAGDPASHKQFSVGTFMFERRSFYTATVEYNSDISDSYEDITFVPANAGVWGNSPWGNGAVWGGEGDQSQIRTYIPLKKQRCRFLGCKFIHTVALETFELYGLSLSVRGYSIPDRNYK